MAKQQTLFQSWGKSSSKDGGTSAQSAVVGEKYGFNDLDFLGDDVTDEELFRACAEAEENYNAPSSPFHVGPSASEHSILNCSVIEKSIPGFDAEAGEMWIYPTNYPVRQYQFNIVHKALFVNTLVCLPTGLGKTFIAAVVMYNFYRWYPHSKVVFLAPTKPLVAQQIEACFSIMGIPQEHTAEMTGSMLPRDRASMWHKKRVFFLTPQVMQNDLSRETCPVKDITCVVFDEAHKALGNYAYCQVIKKLSGAGDHYRVLALSATPGNDLKAVQQVVTNLQISHIELRTEDSFDIQPYIHERKVEKIVVALEGEILDIKNRFEKVLSSVLGRLCNYGVLYHASPDRMSRFQLLQARDKFRSSGPPEGVMAGAVESDFALAMSLFHAFDLLQLHGMRSFYQFLKTTFSSGHASNQSMAKRDIIRSPLFSNIMRDLAEDFRNSQADVADNGPRFPVSTGASSYNEETGSTDARGFLYSHPKLQKLEEVVLDHFSSFSGKDGGCQKPAETRVMIFSQYRESVQEISDMMGRHAPLVKAMTFVGHCSGKSTSKGLTQKEQTEIVKKFREGGYNTLVATCVGEEGLDIGEVDLIVCFDAAKSPIRLVQRMGRTGRKRSGRIVVLVAAGKEENMYSKSQSSKKSIHRAISEGCKNLKLYQSCPRMVPRSIQPRVHKMHMTVGEFVGSKSSKKLASNKGKEASGSRSKYGVAIGTGAGGKRSFLNQQQLSCWSKELALSDREFKAIEKSVGRCLASKDTLSCERLVTSVPGRTKLSRTNPNSTVSSSQRRNGDSSLIANSRQKFSVSLSSWTHLQTAPVQTKQVGHSSKSYMLMSLLEFADLLQTSEGMGESYDLEMKTFLNEADVGPSSTITRDKGPKMSKTRRRAVVDMSDDEDFVTDKISEGRSVTPAANRMDSEGASSKEETPMGSEAGEETEKMDSEDHVYGMLENINDDVTEKDNDVMEQGAGGDEELEDVCYVTASQHMVPRPPSLTSLDWLDGLGSSQTQGQCGQRSKSVSRTSTLVEPRDTETVLAGRVADADRKNEDREHECFNFATPKAPPCQRVSRLFSSKQSGCEISTSTPRRQIYKSSLEQRNSDEQKDSSMDLFDGLSSSDLFDDFSVSGLHSAPGSARKKQDCTKNDDDTVKTSKELSLQALLNNDGGFSNDISTIAESDLEQNWDEEVEEKERSPDDHLPILSASEHSPKCIAESVTEQDSSFQLNVGRRQRKRGKVNCFLDSPSPDCGGKETMTGSRTQVRFDQREVKGTKACPVVLDSSVDEDDDFELPNRKPKRRRLIPSKSNKNKKVLISAADNYVDEEAQVSEDPDMSLEEELENDDYDMADSFINDNSMLTQYTTHQDKPRQRKVDVYTSHKAFSPPETQRDDIFTRRKCHAGKARFRMVFSQRYKLLHHYLNKADGRETYDRLEQEGIQRKNKQVCHTDSEAEEDVLFGNDEDDLHEGGDESLERENDRFDRTEEDWSELPQSFFEDESDICFEENGDIDANSRKQGAGIDNYKRTLDEKKRTRLMSASDEGLEDHEGTKRHSQEKINVRRVKGRNSRRRFEEESVKEKEKPVQLVDLSQYSDVLISPSLLKVERQGPTPRLFSPEFDDWFSDIDHMEG